MPTPNTPMPFGHKYKNRPLKYCDDGFLGWAVKAWWNSDLHEWALVARQVLEERKQNGDTVAGSLDEQADAFLRKHGCFNDAKRIEPRRYGGGGRR